MIHPVEELVKESLCWYCQNCECLITPVVDGRKTRCPHCAAAFVSYPIDKESGDAINHPSHYNTGKIEVIDFIEDQRLGFHEGNVVKYVARARHKGAELEDLKKASWYLTRRINQLEKRNDTTPQSA